MKLVIVGGGSAYTPELIEGVIEHYDGLPFGEVTLMDIDPRRLEILAGLSRRMVTAAGLPIRLTATTDRRRALEGATFVNSLIRVGGMAARVLDETIPAQYGLVGQETTGPGGMMKALRTIPVMLDLAADMVAVCPDAWLINYTNPSGIIAEALGKQSDVRFVGLCSGPLMWSRCILERLGVSAGQGAVDWVGLNHLGFAVRVWAHGRDVTAEAVEAVCDDWPIDADWIRTLGMIPASYLRYYVHRDAVVAEQRAPGYRTRGERVQEIERDLLTMYADPALSRKPDLLQERGGGGYAAVAIAAMHAIAHDSGGQQVVQVLNGGAVDGIPADGAVEIACTVDHEGPHPLPFGPLPLPIRGLIQAVKAYESLTVQAAFEGSERVAMQALMAHPLVPSWDVARPLLRDLLAANARWLPWGRPGPDG